MDALRGFLFPLLITVILFSCGVCATTVTITVYEHGVNLNPVPQAAVYADNSPVGKTDITGTLEFSHSGENDIELQISKLGYDDWTGFLGRNETSLPVELTRMNLSFSAVVFDSDTLDPISEASITLSSHGVKKTETTDNNGSATFLVQANEPFGLEIHAENYQSRTESLEMGFEQKTSQFLLYPDERFIVILRDEEGKPVADAEVLFDGIMQGPSDSRGATTIDLPRGKVYAVNVKKEGYQDYIGQQVIGQDSALVTITLEKIPYTIIISAFDEANVPVPDAVVKVDGELEGSTNQYGFLELQNLSYGIYNITVSHAGYLSESKDAKVTSQGGDFVIILGYERIPVVLLAEENGGKVLPGVLVSLNNLVVGQTDHEGKLELKLRSYNNESINGTKEGYMPASISVWLNSSTNNDTITLVMEPSLNPFIIMGVLGIIIVVIVSFGVALRRKKSNRILGRKGL